MLVESVWIWQLQYPFIRYFGLSELWPFAPLERSSKPCSCSLKSNWLVFWSERWLLAELSMPWIRDTLHKEKRLLLLTEAMNLERSRAMRRMEQGSDACL